MTESRNPKSNGWQMMPKQLCFKDVENPISCFLFCFWLCFVVLQVIVFNVVLQWSSFGELVSMMERNPCCSIDNLYDECESRFLEMIFTVLSREQKDVDEENYMKLAKEEEGGNFFWECGRS